MKLGDRVRTKSRSHYGKVVEYDGGIVYIEQYNGVEIDFPESQIEIDTPDTKPNAKPSSLLSMIVNDTNAAGIKFIIPVSENIFSRYIELQKIAADALATKREAILGIASLLYESSLSEQSDMKISFGDLTHIQQLHFVTIVEKSLNDKNATDQEIDAVYASMLLDK